MRNCISHTQGTTRLLITRIPMFREVVLMSFECPHCHNSNNEIQSGALIQDDGVRYTLCVQNSEVRLRWPHLVLQTFLHIHLISPPHSPHLSSPSTSSLLPIHLISPPHPPHLCLASSSFLGRHLYINPCTSCVH